MSDTLTVPEAATVAGVSVRTMRRWIAGGQVVTSGHGHGRRVVAASLSKEAAKEDTSGQPAGDTVTPVSATAVTETANAANSDTGGHEADRLAALVSELSVRLADQTALTAIWQERARVLGDHLALAPPQDAQPAPEAVPAFSEPAAPSLWLRWAGMSDQTRQALATVLLIVVVLSLSVWTIWLR